VGEYSPKYAANIHTFLLQKEVMKICGLLCDDTRESRGIWLTQV